MEYFAEGHVVILIECKTNRSNPDVLFHQIQPDFYYIGTRFFFFGLSHRRMSLIFAFTCFNFSLHFELFIFHIFFRCFGLCFSHSVSYFFIYIFSSIYDLYFGFNRLSRESTIILLQCVVVVDSYCKNFCPIFLLQLLKLPCAHFFYLLFVLLIYILSG